LEGVSKSLGQIQPSKVLEEKEFEDLTAEDYANLKEEHAKIGNLVRVWQEKMAEVTQSIDRLRAETAKKEMLEKSGDIKGKEEES